MAFTGTDPELLLIRTTVVSVALQALIGRLMANGILDKGDAVSMRELGMQFAADMQQQPDLEEAGTRLAREVEAWWEVTVELG